MGYTLGNKSIKLLTGVHPDLVKVVKRAIEITEQDFTITEGLRSISRQKYLVSIGRSKTLNSRHLTGHAVDLAPWPIDWEDHSKFIIISEAMKKAAKELDIPIEWGGDWKGGWDKPHYQLPHKEYPK